MTKNSMPRLLILDLDDTLFATHSIGEEAVRPLLQLIRRLLNPLLGHTQTAHLIQQLWKRPFDVVMAQYKVAQSIQAQIIHQIQQLAFDFDIFVFEDYPHLQQLPMEKILVTTGFRPLQEAKIKALGIQKDFQAIYIDDPTDQPRQHKKGLFEMILTNWSTAEERVWVIGDNPDSELKAGKTLGLKTIQRIVPGQVKSQNADYGIYSFEELSTILS